MDVAGVSGAGVLVTGAAGDIGAGIAELFLARGARVHVTDMAGSTLDPSARKPGAGGALTSSLCDLADASQVEALARAALDRLGRVDIIVNNAAVQAQGDLDTCSVDLFDHAHAVNVRAPFLLAQHLVPAMRAGGGGAIINIGSVHATAPGPSRLAYAASKSALLGLTRALAVDLGRFNIRVNSVSPGATLTSQLQGAWDQLSLGGIDVMTHALGQHPLGRLAEVTDIAEAVLYLAQAPAVHGIDLRVDGGLLSALRLLPQTGS